MFVPLVNVVMIFVLGAKGSEWAWRNERWRDVEHFKRVQRNWAIWGLVAWGGVIVMPLLAAVFSAVGIIGGWAVGVVLIGVDPGAFWGQMQAGVKVWPDVSNGIIKSLVFGTAVSLIAVLDGYDAKPTAEGVSIATTRTVVVSSLAILALDFVLTVFMFRGIGS